MSDTPKTDNACGWPVGQRGRIESSDLLIRADGPFVHASVARQLERENAALRSDLAIANAALTHQMRYDRDLRRDRDRLDWLITKAPFCVLSTLSSDPVAARLKIDREMEFPTV